MSACPRSAEWVRSRARMRSDGRDVAPVDAAIRPREAAETDLSRQGGRNRPDGAGSRALLDRHRRFVRQGANPEGSMGKYAARLMRQPEQHADFLRWLATEYTPI